jgi:hypothetical protein
VGVVDAGVDDRDLDAFAVDAVDARPRERRRRRGTLTTFSWRYTPTGFTSTTPGIRRSASMRLRGMLTLMPLSALLKLRSTRAPAASRPPRTDSCSAARCTLTVLFFTRQPPIRRLLRRGNGIAGKVTVTFTSVSSSTRGFTLLGIGPWIGTRMNRPPPEDNDACEAGD